MFKMQDLAHAMSDNNNPQAHSSDGINNQSYLNVGNNGTAKMVRPMDKPFIPYKKAPQLKASPAPGSKKMPGLGNMGDGQ